MNSILLSPAAGSHTTATINNKSAQQNNKPALFMRWMLALLVFVTVGANAQMSTTVTMSASPIVGSPFASLGAAITAVNGLTVTGPVVVTSASGSETNPAGGYSITATGTVTNTITIQGASAATSIVTAPNPAGTAGNLNDAIFKIIGGDYITIQGYSMLENNANTTTTAASNNMVEWGVALLYATVTNGAQNCSIRNNIIDLNRTYQNSFGIYSNSTHTAAAIATSATATGANGGNSNLAITGNTITDVNEGIVILGPTAAADQNDGLTIGGSALNANSITNWGTTNAISGYANLSGTVYGIILRNVKNYNVSYNTISSSNAGHTAGANIRGIFVQAFTNAPTGTIVNNINNNNISIRTGLSSATINCIDIANTTGNATTTQNINNNDFNNITFPAASTGALNFIASSQLVATYNTNNNTFTNINLSTSGSVVFFTYAPSLATGNAFNMNGNSIVTGFNKTVAGGTITIWASNASSVAGSTQSFSNNNLSDITFTGATIFAGYSNTDGPVGGGSTKTITGNTFNNIIGGTSGITVMTVGFSTAANISTNTITNVTGGGAITGMLITSVNQNTSQNTISGLASSGAAAVLGISVTAGTTNNVFKNAICNLSGSNATSTVNGIQVSAGTTISMYNNRIADLRTPAASAANPLIGINLTATSGTINVYYNTVHLNGTSTGTNFGSSAISVLGVAASATVDLRNNSFSNASVSNGSGLTVAYRRSSNSLATYASTSNRNNFFGTNIFSDGATNITALAAYKTFVSTRDANSITENPPFLSTTCGNANFLKVNTAIATGLESGAATIGTVTDDFEGDTRAGTPDIGADEFAGTPLPNCTGTPASATINGAASLCTGTGTTLSLSTIYTDLGITYQWRSATVSGGPYTTTLGTNATQATGNLTSTTYYIAEVTCSFSGLTFTTAEKEVLVNALPTVVATPSSATYCTPGGSAVTITASGASTYTWLPTTGITPTTGAVVAASPSATTTYTVTGTDANGCVNTATTIITAAVNPANVTATANPATICTGLTSTLSGTGVVQNTASLANTYAFTGAAGTYAAISGTVLSGATILGDDVGNGNLPIGFTFNYNGTAETVFGISSNGFIQLGNTNATFTGLSANALASTAKVIAAFWDDNNTAGANVQYSTTGAAGSRILTVQWTGMKIGGGGSGTGTLNAQIKLYEGSGVVQIVYGASASGSGAITASIGISGASGNYRSITPLLPASSSTSSTASENISIAAFTNIPSGTTYTFTPASLALSYAWAPSGDVVNPNAQSTVTNALSSTEIFTLTVSNGGCSVTATATVTVSAGAAITVDPAPTTSCAGTNAIFNVTATGPGLTYQWRKGTVDINTVSNPSAATATLTLANVTAADADTYDVVVTATCGSPVTSQGAALTVVTSLAGISAPVTTICSGNPVTLTENGGTATSWSWAPGGATTQAITVSPSITTTYTVTATLNGCNATASQTITVNPTPSAVVITPASATICAGAIQQLTATGGSITSNATLISQNFNGANNWTTGNASTSGTPANAAWTLRANGYVYSATTFNSNDASQFYMSNSDAQGSGGVTSTTLTSPVISTVNFTSLSLSFYHYFRFNASPDKAIVEVSTNGGGSWTAVQTYVATVGTPVGFVNAVINMTPYVGNANVQIRFSFSAPFGYYWAVDNVVVSGVQNVQGNVVWTPNGTGNGLYSDNLATSVYAGTATPTVYASPTATTTYTATSTTGGCSSSANVTVTVNPLANAGTVSGTTPLCVAATATYTSTGDAGGTWSSTNTGVATVNVTTGVVTAVAAGSTDITYTVTNSCGTASAFQTLIVNPNANAGTVTGPTPLCSGSTAPYSSTGDAGGTWSSTNTGVAMVNPSTGEVTAVSAGTTDITYTVTNSCGTASAFQTLTVSPNANAGTVSGTRPLCIGATATYTSTGDAGGTWSSTNIAIATVNATTGLVTAVAAGTTDITYTVGTGCNPPASAFLTLTVSPNANAGTVTGNTPLCIGQPATYLSNGDLGFWSSSNPAVATVDFNTGAITTNSAGTTDITYTVGAGCNSPVSSFKTLTVNPNVNAGTVSGTSPLCIAGTATYSSNGDAGGTWASSNNGIATVDATTGLVTGVAQGTTNITYTVTGVCGGPASASQSVTVQAIDYANLQFPASGSICSSGSLTAYGQVYEPGVTEAGGQGAGITVEIGYNSTNTNPNTWTNWSPATFNVQVGNNDEYQGTVGNGFAPGTYYYTFRYSLNGCAFQYGGYSSGGGNFWDGTNFVSGVLTVNPNANAGTVSGTTPLCVAGTATYTSTGDAGGTWSSTNTGVATVNATTGVVTAVAAGSTDITYIVTNSCGTASAFQTLIVNPNANAGTVSGTSPLCVAGTATYASTGDAGGTWSSTNTGVATVNATTGVVTAVAAGTTDITYTVTNSCGTASAFQTLIVNPNANAGTVTGTTPLCVAATATYTSTGDAGGTWSSTNTGVATVNATTGVVTAIAAGSTDITYTVTNSCGTASAFQTLLVNPNANAGTVTGATPLAVAATATYTSDGDAGGTWSSTNTVVASVNATTGLVTALSAGTTDITYTVNTGCNAPVSAFQTLTVIANTYTITSSAGGNGSISPLGVTTVTSGANQTYTITPAACYHVNDVLVDGLSVGAVTTYTFTNVTANHTISASFVINSPLTVSVSGPVNVCPYVGTGTPITYTATAAGATGFTWVVPPTNVTIISGQGTANLTVTFGNGFTAQNNKQLRVTALSSCGNSDLFIYYLVAQAPGTPAPIIAGSTNVCAIINTPGTITYTIPSVLGATSYVWSNPAGTTITHTNGLGINDTTITLSFSNAFITSNLTVAAANDGCGTSSARSISIVRANPSTPGLIGGPTNACANIAPGGTPATYSIASVTGATSYTWTVPAGAIGLTGQGTTSISFTYPTTFTSGSITVTAANGCGTSSPRSLSISKLNPTAPGVIDVIQTGFCPNRVYTYTVAGIPANATSVQWTVPAGAMILSGQGTASLEVSYPATAIAGFVTAQSVNNCSSSTIRKSEVRLPACPPDEPKLFSKGGNVVAAETMTVNVYPNPSVTDFKLQVVTAGKEKITVRILDMQGRTFKNVTVTANQTISIGADLKAGSYLMEVSQGGIVKTTKLIKF